MDTLGGEFVSCGLGLPIEIVDCQGFFFLEPTYGYPYGDKNRQEKGHLYFRRRSRHEGPSIKPASLTLPGRGETLPRGPMNNLGTMMMIATFATYIREKYRVNPGKNCVPVIPVGQWCSVVQS